MSNMKRLIEEMEPTVTDANGDVIRHNNIGSNGSCVYHDESWGCDHIVLIDRYGGEVYFCPDEMLLLLNWLMREKDKLKKLVKGME